MNTLMWEICAGNHQVVQQSQLGGARPVVVKGRVQGVWADSATICTASTANLSIEVAQHNFDVMLRNFAQDGFKLIVKSVFDLIRFLLSGGMNVHKCDVKVTSMKPECTNPIVDRYEISHKLATSVANQETYAKFMFIHVIALTESYSVATVIDDAVAD